MRDTDDSMWNDHHSGWRGSIRAAPSERCRQSAVGGGRQHFARAGRAANRGSMACKTSAHLLRPQLQCSFGLTPLPGPCSTAISWQPSCE